MNDFFSGRDCFFTDPAWQEVTREPWDPAVDPELHVLIESFIAILARFPAIVRDALALRARTAAGLGDIPKIVDMLNKTTGVYFDLIKWHERFEARFGRPQEMTSPTNDPLFPICYQHVDFASATLYCGYCACLAISQEILSDSKYPLEFQTPTDTLVEDICKFVEWNGQGGWGPYRMGFSMHIASEVGKPKIKVWIRSWSMKFSKTYKAITPRESDDEKVV